MRNSDVPLRRGFIRGAAVGAIAMAVFGSWWVFASLIMRTPRVSPLILALAALPPLAIVAFAIRHMLHAGRMPKIANAAEEQRWRSSGMKFGIIFGIEAVLIAAAATLLANAGRPLLIPIAVAIIVGLHFPPLAAVFGVPLYHWTGALVTLWSVACLAFADVPLRLLLLGIGVGLVLWATGVGVLVQYRPTLVQSS